MSLDLILPLAEDLPGSYTLGRELTSEDALELVKARVPVRGALKRITSRHHAIARSIADGVTQTDVAILYGMAVQTVHMLTRDPSFKALVSFYRQSEHELSLTVHEKFLNVTSLAIDRLEERLEDDETADKITVPQLLSIIETGADRTGHGPQSTNVSVNINANIADRMKAARERAAQSIASQGAAA